MSGCAPPCDNTRGCHIVSRLRGLIRGSRTALASFYHEWEQCMHGDNCSARCDPKPGKATSGRSRGGGLFPCAALARSRPSRPSSSRRAARWRRRLAAKEMVQFVLGVSSWLALGGPEKCPGELQSPTSPAHGLALVHIETSSLRRIRLIKPSPALVGCGRRGPAVARQRRAPRLAGGVSGRSPRVRTGTGRPCAAGSRDRKTTRA